MLVATSCLDGMGEGIDAWNASAVVSVAARRFRAPLVADRPQLILAFYDIESAFAGDRIGPQHRDIAAFLDFVTDAPSRLLVHCVAGLGRSPALAAVALAASGLSAEAACLAIARSVPEAMPNRRVLRLGGEALGIGLALRDAAEAVFPAARSRLGARGEATGFRPPASAQSPCA